MTTPVRRFPFSAVVAQDDARLALLLAAVDPAIGGVLLRGEKGSAKSTMARGLAGLLPGGAPFVELPLGTDAECVVGALDPHALDGHGEFLPGLLASAHGGVLYVDEVNLLPDSLIDALLDVVASGVNRIERPGLSHEHPARFVLVGSMNPEEGELRPQLLGRFGLAVEVSAPDDADVRAEIVRRRLAHDAGAQVDGDESDIILRARLAAAMPADLSDEIIDFACRLAVSIGAEGLRADLVLCRTPGQSDKNPRYRAVEAGTTPAGLPPLRVVAWIGDNIRDFPALDQDAGAAALAPFGERYFMLPNPMYGSWESLPRR